jgi:hypothetical protein
MKDGGNCLPRAGGVRVEVEFLGFFGPPFGFCQEDRGSARSEIQPCENRKELPSHPSSQLDLLTSGTEDGLRMAGSTLEEKRENFCWNEHVVIRSSCMENVLSMEEFLVQL